VKRLLAACIIAVSACAQAPEQPIVAASQPAPEQVITDHEACAYYPAIFVGPPIARQGAELKVGISEPVGAYAPRPIPSELLTGWKAMPAGQVDLARDGSKLTVLPTATPGRRHPPPPSAANAKSHAPSASSQDEPGSRVSGASNPSAGRRRNRVKGFGISRYLFSVRSYRDWGQRVRREGGTLWHHGGNRVTKPIFRQGH
jgi:hypothetical protein